MAQQWNGVYLNRNTSLVTNLNLIFKTFAAEMEFLERFIGNQNSFWYAHPVYLKKRSKIQNTFVAPINFN